MPNEDHPPVNHLTIATRGSQLALWQAHYIKDLLAQHGLADVRLLIVKTTGDRVQDRFLHEIGGKGVFVRELEQALLAGDADLAVHSLKDLPAITPAPFALSAVLPRHRSGDLLVLHPAVSSRLGLRDGATVQAADLQAWGALRLGTGSLRRRCLLEEASPQLEVVAIRGNVDTRLRKLREGQWDGIVLAEASLERLPLADDLVKLRFDPQWFVPSASQGALVVETIGTHPAAAWLQAKLNCAATHFCVSLERAVLSALGGDCTLPIGVHAALTKTAAGGQQLSCQAVLLGPGVAAARAACAGLLPEGQTPDPGPWCRKLVAGLLTAGANEVLQALKLPMVSL